MGILSETNIGRVNFLFGTILVCVALFSAGYFFVINTRQADYEELRLLERRLIEQEKVRLETDVESFIVRIWLIRERLLRERSNLGVIDAAEAGRDSGEYAESESGGVSSPEFDPQSLVAALDNARDLDIAGFFIYDLHDPDGGERFATMIFNPARPDLVGRTLSTEDPDARGFKFRKAFVKDIRDRGKSFVVYHYNRDPGAAGELPPVGRKLSYFRLDESTGWVVAGSVLLDGIDRFLAASEVELDRAHRADLMVLGGVFLVSILVALLLAAVFSSAMRAVFARRREAEAELRMRTESLQKTLERQSRTDPLTTAFNRGHFNQELVKEIARAGRYQTPLTMILFDVDDFKSINDALGCEAGDTVLVELVELVGDNIRQTDLLARWEGEEFVILAPGIDLDQGRLFAEKLRDLIAGHRFTIERPLTCSFGIGYYESPEDKHRFVKRIGEALGRAKEAGKNRCSAA